MPPRYPYAGAGDAYFRLTDVAGRALDRLGQSDVDRAKMDLATKQMDYSIGRQKAQDTRQEAMDALTRPGLELASQQSRQQLAALNEPVRFDTLYPDEYSQVHAVYGADKPEGMAGTLWGKTENLLGGKLDTTPGSPTYGQMLKPDGKVLNRGELLNSGKLPQWGGMVLAHTDLFKGLRDKQSRLLDEVQKGGLTKERAGQIKSELEGIDAISRNPRIILPNLQRQYEVATTIGDDFNAKRIQAQIDALTKEQVEERKDTRKFERDMALERVRQGGMDRRAKELAGGRETKAGAQAGKERAKAWQTWAKDFSSSADEYGTKVENPYKASFLASAMNDLAPQDHRRDQATMAQLSRDYDEALMAFKSAGLDEATAAAEAEASVMELWQQQAPAPTAAPSPAPAVSRAPRMAPSHLPTR